MMHLVRHAINRASRGKHDALDPSLPHRRQQRERALDIVAVVKFGLANRLADIGESGEMHDRGDPVRTQRVSEPCPIVQITFYERSPAYCLRMAARQIDVDDGTIPGAGQRLARMTADIPGAAGDED